MALTSPTHGRSLTFPPAPAEPRSRPAERSQRRAPERPARREEGATRGPATLRMRRGALLALGLFAPLLAALAGFAMQQHEVTELPAPLVEAVPRGRILASDGTVLADGPADARRYPQGALAGVLVGFTGADQPDGSYGLEGLEYSLDGYLASGADAVLTIDPVLQAATERHLAASAEAHSAESGAAVILEVGTGNVLAAASFPNYDPNDWRDEFANQSNRAFLLRYEPGSVVKPLVVAGLLETGRLSPSEMIDAPMTLRVGEKTFRDVARHDPVLAVPDVLAYSSNSAMIALGQRFAPNELYDWLGRFGIGQDLDLRSSYTASGSLNDWRTWVPQDHAANSIGQNHNTTPLQLAAAYGVIANDGLYVPPRLLADEVVPEPHRVISPEVAQSVRSMLIHVMENGGLRESGIPGVSVAGKTGTADIWDDTARAYLPGDYSLTFAGMFPAERPRAVVVVTLRKPDTDATSTYVAAPLFRAIGSEVVAHWGTAPSVEAIANAP